MQLKSLQMFVDLIESGSFSRSAQINHVTQSAVSQAIRVLEAHYSQRLVSRSNRAGTPTEAGGMLYRAAKDLLCRLTETENEVREHTSEVTGTVAISAIPSVGIHELIDLQRELIHRHPRVRLRLSYRRFFDVYDDILLGVADLGVVAYPEARPGLTVARFRSDRMAVVVAPSHPFASRGRITLEDMAGVPLIAFQQGSPSRMALDAVFAERGLSPQVVLEMDDVETMKRAAELDLGAALLPLPCVQFEIAKGTLLTKRLVDGPKERPLGILIRGGRTLSRALRATLDILGADGGIEKHQTTTTGGLI